MMKLIAGAVMAMSMLAGAAHAGEWRVVSDNSRTANLTDVSTIRVTANGKKNVWSAMIYATAFNDIKYIKTLEEVDCDLREYSVLATYAYGVDGGFLDSIVERKPADPVIPDSDAELVFSVVCEGSQVLQSRPWFESVGAAIQAWNPAPSRN